MTCERCGMVQFEVTSGLCRRCKRPCYVRAAQQLRQEQQQAIQRVLRARLAKRLKKNEGRNLHDMLGLLMGVFRKATGLSQQEFGERIGAHTHWVHNSEKSLNEWTAKRIDSAARAVGIPAWIYVELAMIALGHGSGILHGNDNPNRKDSSDAKHLQHPSPEVPIDAGVGETTPLHADKKYQKNTVGTPSRGMEFGAERESQVEIQQFPDLVDDSSKCLAPPHVSEPVQLSLF